MRRSTVHLLLVLAVVLSALAVAGCGGSQSSGTKSSPPKSSPPGSKSAGPTYPPTVADDDVLSSSTPVDSVDYRRAEIANGTSPAAANCVIKALQAMGIKTAGDVALHRQQAHTAGVNCQSAQ